MSFTINVSEIIPVDGRRYGYQVEKLCERTGAVCYSINEDPEYLDGTDDEDLLKKHAFSRSIHIPDPDLTLKRIGVDLGKHAPWGWNSDNSAWTFCSRSLKEEFCRLDSEYINVGWEYGPEREGPDDVMKHNREISLLQDKLYDKVEETVFEIPKRNIVWRNVWTEAILEKNLAGANAHPCTAFYDEHEKMFVYRVFHRETFINHLTRYFGYDEKEKEMLASLFLPLFREGQTYLCYSW